MPGSSFLETENGTIWLESVMRTVTREFGVTSAVEPKPGASPRSSRDVLPSEKNTFVSGLTVTVCRPAMSLSPSTVSSARG
jgi:hypothetical protein